MYGLPRPVPFLDVHVERDNLMFIEPSRVRVAARSGDQYAAAALSAVTSYFDEVLDTVRTNDRARGLVLLENLHEPNETRLGMTRVGVAGHGVGAELARQLWVAMRRNPTCCNAIIVRRIEDLAPFVDGVGPDLISDLMTRIVFGVLADFTADMVSQYPQLSRCTSLADELVWDVPARGWAGRTIELPVAAGQRLLLVPTNWAWPRQLLTASSFYQVQALGRIQDKLTVVPSRRGARPIAPRKLDLRVEHPNVRPTNIEQALDAAQAGISLTDRHATHLQSRIKREVLTSEQVNALI